LDRSSGYGKRTVLGCLVVLVAMFLCVGVSMFTMDRLCYESLSHRIPLYPGAEIRAERHNLLTARGMGETYMELYSPDPPDTVSEWYGRMIGQYTREAIRNHDFIYTLARSERSVHTAEDGSGSMIELYGTCAQ
jgi:hypothetical protein